MDKRCGNCNHFQLADSATGLGMCQYFSQRHATQIPFWSPVSFTVHSGASADNCRTYGHPSMIAELPPSPQEGEDDWKWYDSPAREERDKRTEERLEALEAEVRQLQVSREDMVSKSQEVILKGILK